VITIVAATAGLFFTGTDTGVGKTFVLAAVARLLRQQGRGVRVCKPVATGAAWLMGRWVSEDTLRLAEAAGLKAEAWPKITPWSFPEPAAPPVAARAQGKTLRIADLAEAVLRQAEPDTILLVEGVGGLLCPLTEQETVADLAALLGMPLIVVVRRSLGTLNHTLLTLEVARSRQLPVAGVVVNETTRPRGLAEESNVIELTRRIVVPVLAVMPYQKEAWRPNLEALAAAAWWQLAQRAVV
jgi:dethiobiotin synthetase